MELGGVGIEGVLYCYPMKCGLRRVAVATVRGRGIRHSRRQSASVSTCPLSANLGHLPPQHIFLPHQLPDHPNDTVARASNTNVGTPDERHNFGKIKPEPVSKAGGSQLRSG